MSLGRAQTQALIVRLEQITFPTGFESLHGHCVVPFAHAGFLVDLVGECEFVVIEFDSESRSGWDFHFAALKSEVRAFDDVGSVDEPGVMRVAGMDYLWSDGSEMCHRGHRQTRVIVGVL